MTPTEKIPSVNFHLWAPCNMRCGFCFAGFLDVKRDVLPKGHLNREDCVRVVEALADVGFAKINFAGGEPTLCPWLADLIQTAKARGLATSIVTNGTRIDPERLSGVKDVLDWIALSVDTVDPDKLRATGRVTPRGPMSERDYLKIAADIREGGFGLKINTVVTSVNQDEDFTDFILRARPARWKILQFLPVADQNGGSADEFIVSKRSFDEYVERNRIVEKRGVAVIPEDNAMMTGSYAMVDPAGRFFDNAAGRHAYSRPILEAGAREALSDVSIDAERFSQRGGLYDWSR